MDASELHKKSIKMNLDDATKTAILEVIDIKTNSDMREVIQKIDSLSDSMGTKIQGMEVEIRGMEKSMGTKIQGMEVEIRGMEKVLESKINNIKWTISTVLIIIGLIIALILKL